MIKNIAILMIFYSVSGALLAQYAFDSQFAISLLLGGLLMLLNLAGIALIWWLIFSKKSIALASVVIIFKYVLLGAILWTLAAANWLKPIAFCLGLASLLFAILVATFIKSVLAKKS